MTDDHLEVGQPFNQPGNRNVSNHFVVVTGIDTKAGVVHLNDSGIKTGRDEQVPI